MATPPDHLLASAVLKVGDGRGFVVRRRMHGDRVVITAAHCLPVLPPAHPGACTEVLTYPHLLGPLRAKPTVSAECLFADPVADIAVLGTPDRQALVGQADAYEVLVDRARPLKIAQAPERDDYNVAECEARVLSLDGHWRDGRVRRTGFGGWLSFFPEKFCEGGMSGSPIIDMSGKAIGIVSVDLRSPVLVDSLSTGLLRSIRTCLPSLKYRRVSRLLDEAKQT